MNQDQNNPYGNPYNQNELMQLNPAYEYDLSNIQYRPMTVDQWAQIPNNQSYYSQYWENPTCFEPTQFATNMKAETKYYDSKYSILFIINLIITIILIVFLAFTFKVEMLQNFFKDDGFNSTQTMEYNKGGVDQQEVHVTYFSSLRVPFFLSLFISFCINIIHFTYAHFCSQFYIKFGMIVGVTLSVLSGVISLLFGGVFQMISSILIIALSIIWYCVIRTRIPFSASIFKITTKLVLDNPSIILVCFLESFLNVIINFGYLFVCICTAVMNLSAFWYVYSVFSYTWITLTISYVIYMTGAGVAASWYFLQGTEYYPSSPTWSSLKRSLTTSFGSCSLAGFILAVIEAIRSIIKLMENSTREHENDRDDDRPGEACSNIISAIFHCMALCILNILESLVKWITRYALIYCAMYGIPYEEGCRRWAELEFTRFVNVLIDGCVIKDSMTYNSIVFIVATGFISFSLSLIFYSVSSTETILIIIMSVIFTFVGLTFLNDPVITMSDTLLVCFAESPDTLKNSNADLHDTLSRTYTNQLNARL